MRIHAIRTGWIDIKNNYYRAWGKLRLLRLASVLIDMEFRRIPVYTWAIEHPEGVIVIDAGESARVHDPDYFPAPQRPFWRSQYRFHITPQDEIGPQLRLRGIDPEAVRWVVLTHAHFDHTDGLHHFPNAQVLFSHREFDDIMRWRSAHFGFPSRWPTTIKPVRIDYVPEPIGSFDTSHVLTQAGDVRLVPTPGHTLGHQSVILQADGMTYFFGGDTSFDLDSLMNGTIDAPTFDSNRLIATRRRILDYASNHPLVYLTTHDPETEVRLNARMPIATAAAYMALQQQG